MEVAGGVVVVGVVLGVGVVEGVVTVGVVVGVVGRGVGVLRNRKKPAMIITMMIITIRVLVFIVWD